MTLFYHQSKGLPVPLVLRKIIITPRQHPIPTSFLINIYNSLLNIKKIQSHTYSNFLSPQAIIIPSQAQSPPFDNDFLQALSSSNSIRDTISKITLLISPSFQCKILNDLSICRPLNGDSLVRGQSQDLYWQSMLYVASYMNPAKTQYIWTLLSTTLVHGD